MRATDDISQGSMEDQELEIGSRIERSRVRQNAGTADRPHSGECRRDENPMLIQDERRQ